MNYMKQKIKNINFPYLDYGKVALIVSVLAIAFVVSSSNSPCLQAQSTCSIGSDNEFTGNISIKGGTVFKSTLDASGITSDRTITIPNASGTILLGGGLGASKVVATDVSGELTTTEIYPLSIGTSGEVLTVDGVGEPTWTAPASAAPSVTYETLDATGDVGNGLDQLAIGNHIHVGSDIGGTIDGGTWA